jgi:threonine dehydrogenase-like Zn-dependent dehydrogenase
VKAAKITKAFNVDIIEIEKPEISDGQMLVKNNTASICGSDLPYFLNERNPQYPLPPGFPGHECIGIVMESRSKEFKEGDKVLSIPNGDRGFAEYFTTSPSRTVMLPNINDEFVVAQPLGTVVHACRKLFEPLLTPANNSLDVDTWDLCGRNVAIVGQGSIGLLFTAMMKLMKAEKVIGIDPMDYRLESAMNMGATHVINPSQSNMVEMVSKITNGQMADLAIEAVGKDSTVNDCFTLVKRSGVVLAFGVPRKSVYDFVFPEFFNKEVKLLGSLGPDIQSEFPVAVNIISDKKIDVSKIISHRIKLDNIQMAFEMVAERKDGAIKVLINF